MNEKNPVNNMHELLKCLIKGINPIYVTEEYYFFNNKDEILMFPTLISEVGYVAHVYGCKFIKVSKK